MRARMTAVCVLLLAPFLLLTSKILALTTSQMERDDDAKVLQKIASVASEVVSDDQWRSLLPELVNPI